MQDILDLSIAFRQLYQSTTVHKIVSISTHTHGQSNIQFMLIAILAELTAIANIIKEPEVQAEHKRVLIKQHLNKLDQVLKTIIYEHSSSKLLKILLGTIYIVGSFLVLGLILNLSVLSIFTIICLLEVFIYWIATSNDTPITDMIVRISKNVDSAEFAHAPDIAQALEQNINACRRVLQIMS
jgi:hypothetical protein